LRAAAATIVILALLVGCGRPVAQFSAEGPFIAGKQGEFINLSDHAESINWYADGQRLSGSDTLNYCFLSSGRHILTIEAIKGNKTSRSEKEILVDAPLDCHYLIRTNYGDMIVRLSEKTAQHLTRFDSNVINGVYTDNSFHRVIEGFVIQGGLLSGEAQGADNEIQNESDAGLVHYRGALAAARMPDEINPERKSSPTQFYIVQGRPIDEEALLNYASEKLIDYSERQKNLYLERGGTPQLDGAYTVFGELVSGFDVLDRIAAVPTDASDKPRDKVKIIEITQIN